MLAQIFDMVHLYICVQWKMEEISRLLRMSDEYDVKTDNLTMETCSVKQLIVIIRTDLVDCSCETGESRHQ